MTFGIDDAIAEGLQIINKFVPDPEQREKATLELAQLKQASELAELNADTQLAQGQIDTNKVEAASEDNYTRRARPTIIYICGAGFGYQYILQPFALLLLHTFKIDIIIPNLDMTAIGTVLLGLSGLRSVDKFKGVTK